MEHTRGNKIFAECSPRSTGTYPYFPERGISRCIECRGWNCRKRRLDFRSYIPGSYSSDGVVRDAIRRWCTSIFGKMLKHAGRCIYTPASDPRASLWNPILKSDPHTRGGGFARRTANWNRLRGGGVMPSRKKDGEKKENIAEEGRAMEGKWVKGGESGRNKITGSYESHFGATPTLPHWPCFSSAVSLT